MTITKIVCKSCGNEVEKPLGEVNRQRKNGKTNFYCNNVCSGKAGRPTDEFSPFRAILTSIKKTAKSRSKEINLTLNDLKQLWDAQNGKCAYTKKQMILSGKEKHIPESASLDRIDSEKGYVLGNIEFVCLFINYGKNGFSKNQIKNFLGDGTA